MVCTVAITFLVDFIIKKISNKKTQKLSIKKQNEQEIEQIINTFVYNPQSFSVNFFYKMLSKKHNCIKKSKYIIVQNSNKTIIYPCFLFRELNEDDIIEIYNKTKTEDANKIIICFNKINSKTKIFTQKLPTQTVLLNATDTYLNLLTPYDCYPEKTSLTESNSINFKYLLNHALNKERTRGYFISSILLLFSSFFVPYKLYYVITSSILLILAFICFSNPSFTKIKKSELFD